MPSKRHFAPPTSHPLRVVSTKGKDVRISPHYAPRVRSQVSRILDLRLLNLAEVAEILGTSVANVRRLIEVGRLPAVNVAGLGRRHAAWRVHPDDLQDYVFRAKTIIPSTGSPGGSVSPGDSESLRQEER